MDWLSGDVQTILCLKLLKYFASQDNGIIATIIIAVTVFPYYLSVTLHTANLEEQNEKH